MPGSEFRFEKARVPADLTLVTGVTVSGCFFVVGALPTHKGPERIGDLLNAESGFFPFQRADGTTALYNRSHVVLVGLKAGSNEAEREPGYDVATRRPVVITLTSGTRITGTVAVYRPTGRDRLSDYLRNGEQFRYVVGADQTFILNSAHIVELSEVS